MQFHSIFDSRTIARASFLHCGLLQFCSLCRMNEKNSSLPLSLYIYNTESIGKDDVIMSRACGRELLIIHRSTLNSEHRVHSNEVKTEAKVRMKIDALYVSMKYKIVKSNSFQRLALTSAISMRLNCPVNPLSCNFSSFYFLDQCSEYGKKVTFVTFWCNEINCKLRLVGAIFTS